MRWKSVAIACVAIIVAALFVHGRLRAADVPVTRAGHMEMTLRAASEPGDAARGAAILAAAKALAAKYADVADAERDGYKKFLPNIPLPIEHYTNGMNALRANFGSFDPMAPTSIIYKRTANGLVVAGVMYTAPNRFDAAQLDARVPLSLATWHRHVDFCWPPAGMRDDPRFGMSGSIVTKDDCEAAGGRFIPRVFNWMVHVWPNETDPRKIWAVDAGMSMGHHDGAGMVSDQTTLPIPLDQIPSVAVALGDAGRGRAIFAGNCASCHGPGGANGPDAPRLRSSGITEGQAAYMVRHPRAIDPSSEMPDFGFTDRDVADVSAYVASLSR
jgi:mono/diheme cytochrome c family protein